MRKLTWLRPAPIDNPPAGVLAHAVSDHELRSPLLAGELTRCRKPVETLPAGRLVQDWRCPYSASNTCQDCVRGLVEDEYDGPTDPISGPIQSTPAPWSETQTRSTLSEMRKVQAFARAHSVPLAVCLGTGKPPRIFGRGRHRGAGRCGTCNHWINLEPTIDSLGFPVLPLLCSRHLAAPIEA